MGEEQKCAKREVTEGAENTACKEKLEIDKAGVWSKQKERVLKKASPGKSPGE